MTYVIEKDIPLTDPRRKPRKYPFDDMHIGDSFFIKTADWKNVAGACNYYRKKTGKKFTIRMVDGGKRCWRIK